MAFRYFSPKLSFPLLALLLIFDHVPTISSQIRILSFLYKPSLLVHILSCLLSIQRLSARESSPRPLFLCTILSLFLPITKLERSSNRRKLIHFFIKRSPGNVLLLDSEHKKDLTKPSNGKEMCTDFRTRTEYSGCTLHCARVETLKGPTCEKKPAGIERCCCPYYKMVPSGSEKVKGKCPTHR